MQSLSTTRFSCRRLNFSALQKALLIGTDMESSIRPAISKTPWMAINSRVSKSLFSTQAAETTTQASTDNTEENQDSSSSQSVNITDRPRNKALADIIRLGLSSLNRAALDIQNNSLTKRSLFEEYTKQDLVKEYKRESNHVRLMRKANECLAHLAERRGLLMVKPHIMLPQNSQRHAALPAPEPIVLVDCKFTGHRSADIYWSLPVSILLTNKLSKLDKQFLEYKLHQHITEYGAGKTFSHAVHQAFSHKGFPPKITLVPAKDAHILQLLQDNYALGEDHHHGNDEYDDDTRLRQEYEFEQEQQEQGRDSEDEGDDVYEEEKVEK